MIRVLFFAGCASLFIDLFNETDAYPFFEGFSIICACAFIGILSALCEYGKNNQYLILHEAIKEEKVTVIRGNSGLS